MKKRLFSMFLCLCMVFTMVNSMVPTAWATSIDDCVARYSTQITITSNNPYYSDSKKATQDVYKDGTLTLMCTAYVWQKVYDLSKIELPFRGNAQTWYQQAKDNPKFETGSTPKQDSIVVYSGGGYGHVAYVTAVNGNTMTVAEAGRKKWANTTGGVGTESGRINTVGSADRTLGGEVVLGYIYLNAPVPVDPPLPPTNITYKWISTGSKWSAEISWDKSDGATYYNVQYRTAKSGGAWKTDSDYSSGDRYISNGLKDYPYYEYRIQAGNSGGVSNWKYYTLQKPNVVSPPAKPENISTNWTLFGGIGTRVSWSAVSGAESYEIQYRKADSGNWSATVVVNAKTYHTFHGLRMDSAYNFRIKAVNASGSSSWAEGFLPAPKDIVENLKEKEPAIENSPLTVAAPTGISCKWESTGSNATAKLTWNTVSDVDYYEVGYKKAGGSWETVPLCIYNSNTSYIFDNLNSYASYSLRVKAVKSNVSSAWTECTLAKIEEVIPPTNPINVSGAWMSTGPKWQARISWNAVSGATYYEVQYRTPKTGNVWRTDADYSSGTSYISTGLGDYTSYDYRVRACNSAGTSGWTEYTLIKKDGTSTLPPDPPDVGAVPDAPTAVSGAWTSTGPKWQARISWNAVSGAMHYEVQYRTPKTGNEWRADADYSSGTSYISTGLGDYTSYDYRVRACNSAGTSGWTEYTLIKEVGTSTLPPDPPDIGTVPDAPSTVSGTWTSTGPKWQARIAWNAVSGATHYEVQYRTPKTGNAWRADADYSSGTSYISTGLGDYNSYDYRVRACNSAGASAWTTYTLVKSTPAAPAATAPTAPTNISGSWTSMGPKWQARISWAAVSDATYYEVQYRTPKTGNAWKADPDYSSGTSYISTGLKDYNSYDYRVRVVNANGVSGWTEFTLYK